MNLQIKSERGLETAKDFLKFIEAHKRASDIAKESDTDLFVLVTKQNELINTLTETVKSKHIELVRIRSEKDRMKKQIDDLEREVRVSRDLLSITRSIDDAK